MVRGAYIERAPADRLTVADALKRYLAEVTPAKRPVAYDSACGQHWLHSYGHLAWRWRGGAAASGYAGHRWPDDSDTADASCASRPLQMDGREANGARHV